MNPLEYYMRYGVPPKGWEVKGDGKDHPRLLTPKMDGVEDARLDSVCYAIVPQSYVEYLEWQKSCEQRRHAECPSPYADDLNNRSLLLLTEEAP